jgi:hypothetical protein
VGSGYWAGFCGGVLATLAVAFIVGASLLYKRMEGTVKTIAIGLLVLGLSLPMLGGKWCEGRELRRCSVEAGRASVEGWVPGGDGIIPPSSWVIEPPPAGWWTLDPPSQEGHP